MKSSPILAAAALFARGALSTCSLAGSLAGRTCEWQGTSPACGEAEAGLELGKDTAGGGQLVAWTRDHSWSELFDLGSEGVSDDGFDLYKAVLPCAEQYGAVCLGGYKRLVCKGEKIPQETLDAVNSPGAPCAEGDGVCVKRDPKTLSAYIDFDEFTKGERVGGR